MKDRDYSEGSNARVGCQVNLFRRSGRVRVKFSVLGVGFMSG